MGTLELAQAERLGIVSKSTADAEWARRRQVSHTHTAPQGATLTMKWDPATSTFQSVSSETATRSFVNGAMQFIDLDDQLTDAEYRHEEAQRRLAETTAALDQARAAIAAYDRQQEGAPDDHGDAA